MGSVIPLSSILSKATERQVEGTYIPPSGLRKVQREEARGKARAIRKPAVRVQAANQQLISEDNLKGSTMYHTHVCVCGIRARLGHSWTASGKACRGWFDNGVLTNFTFCYCGCCKDKSLLMSLVNVLRTIDHPMQSGGAKYARRGQIITAEMVSPCCHTRVDKWPHPSILRCSTISLEGQHRDLQLDT